VPHVIQNLLILVLKYQFRSTEGTRLVKSRAKGYVTAGNLHYGLSWVMYYITSGLL